MFKGMNFDLVDIQNIFKILTKDLKTKRKSPLNRPMAIQKINTNTIQIHLEQTTNVRIFLQTKMNNQEIRAYLFA